MGRFNYIERYKENLAKIPNPNEKLIDADGYGGFYCHFKYNKEFLDWFKYNLPVQPKWEPSTRTWNLGGSPDTLLAIDALIHGHGFRLGEAGKAQRIKLENVEKVEGTYVSKDMELTAELDSDLYPHQVAAVRFIKQYPRCLIGDDVGLGKTRTAIAGIEEHNAFPCIVVCPAIVKSHWVAEWEAVKAGRKVQVLQGQGHNVIDDDTDIIILNFEILQHQSSTLKVAKAKSIIIDEMHRIKNYKTKSAQAYTEIAKDVTVRLGLTGTPMPNGNIYELASILTGLGVINEVGGWNRFTNRYGVFKYDGWKNKCVGIKNEGELQEKLSSSVMVRRMKEDVRSDLPRKTRGVMVVDLDTRTGYNKAEKELTSWVHDQHDAPRAGGKEYMEGLALINKMRMEAGLAKVGPAIEWARGVIEAGRKPVMFTYHVDVARAIKEALKDYGVTLITGQGCMANERLATKDQAKDAFTSGATSVVVATIGAAGTGMDGLQRVASDMAFVELPWTPGEIDQTEGRLYRMGQESTVFTTLLVGKNTIDESDMIPTLIRKDSNIEAAMGDGKEYVLRQVFDRLSNGSS